MTSSFSLLLVAAILAVSARCRHAQKLELAPLARQDHRLPLEVVPVSYELTLSPSLTDASFTGGASISVTPLVKELSTVTLHVHPSLNVTSASLRYKGQSVGITTPEAGGDPLNDFYVVRLDQPLTPEEGGWGSLVLDFNFAGVLTQDMQGFYRSQYLNKDGQTEYLGVTQLEATGARMVFPCFDEPGLKATFRLSISAPPGYSALSNTPLDGPPQRNVDAWRVFTFQETPPMSTYLLATVISKFELPQASPADPNNQVWSSPRTSAQVQYAASKAAAVMQAVETITGLPYVTGNITKVDNVAVPDFPVGAMENWGLVTYRQTRLLVHEDETPTSMRKQVNGDLAHEYGHQFFGDLVTPRWWNLIWLSEGFASYVEYHANALVEPGWRMDEQFVVDEVHQALDVDSRLDTRPMTVYEDNVLSKEQISAVFDDVAYAKGGSIVRMMEHVLGTDIFRRGLKNYLEKMSLKAATDEDLFHAMAEVAGTLHLGGFSLKEILRSWTNTYGYPLLTVTRDYNASTASVIQTRFLISGLVLQRPTWITPVNWATSSEEFGNTKPTLWLNQVQTLTFPMEEPLLNSSTWLLVNNHRTGFYRVNYDEDNWRLLTAQLHADHSVFPAVTQAQLLDDAFALARSGWINYSVALDLTVYLEKQDDLIPWTAALSGFSFVRDRLVGSAYYHDLQMYMHKIMGPVFSTFNNFVLPENSTHTRRLLISKIAAWECRLGSQQCSDQSARLLREVDGAGNSRVPADVRAAVYCEAVRSGGGAAWTSLWEHYDKTVVASEETLVLQALACSKDQETLRQLLNKTTVPDSGIRKQDSRSVYLAVCDNPDAFDVLAAFVEEQVAADNLNGMTDVVKCLASKVNKDVQRDRIKALASLVNLDVSRVTEENIRWLHGYEGTVGEWLKAHHKSSADTAQLAALAVVVLAAVNSVFGV